MTDRLFPLLLLLTLLDVGFVHATAVVDGFSLLPLWLLGAAAPWLRNLQRYRGHRIAWNGCVMLVFALLVHHATTTGLLHMLEDGLVLAVLCQVHLVNNVGERQRPDLIFFNSFLIAFVTSFFAPDIQWCALFLVHSFALVQGLQVYCLSRACPRLPPLTTRTLRGDGIRRTLVIGAVTAIAFVGLPRDFHRHGWLGETLALQQQLEAGLAERIEIGDEHSTRLSNELVATITPSTGPDGDVPSHWRAMAFSAFDGSAWEAQDQPHLATRFATDEPWRQHPDGSLQRGNASDGVRYEITMHDLTARRLPLPLAATGVCANQAESLRLEPRPDGGILWSAVAGPSLRPLSFVVTTSRAASSIRPSRATIAQMTNLPPRGVPSVVRDLAATLRAELPADTDTMVLADTFAQWLQQHRRYQLPGEPGFARNLGEFLLGSGAGHCEYFATALALLLRAQQVPCRLVGGYLVTEWDPAMRRMLVRGKHAHAWVEVLDAGGRWHTFDATPAAERSGGESARATWWSSVQDLLTGTWRAITEFDQAARSRWLFDLGRALTAPGTILVLLMAAVGGVVYSGRRRQALPAIVSLHRAMRAAGLSLRRGETPRELLERANTLDLAPSVRARLRAATAAHEQARYGQDQVGVRP